MSVYNCSKFFFTLILFLASLQFASHLKIRSIPKQRISKIRIPKSLNKIHVHYIKNYTKIHVQQKLLYKSIFWFTKLFHKPRCPHTSTVIYLLLGVTLWLFWKLQKFQSMQVTKIQSSSYNSVLIYRNKIL